MSVRSLISKDDRVKVVNWIRSGAPLKEGVSLYSALPFQPNLLNDLKRDPEANEHRFIGEICRLMNIPASKFHSIIKQYHGKEQKQLSATGSEIPDRPGEREDISGQIKPVNKSNRSFRSEWPFLSRPECPPELKALAADKISAWERYTEAHKKLFDCSSLEECFQTARELMESFKENRLIFEELNYYRQHGTPMGKHPIWDKFKRFEDLRGMNVIDLVRLYEKTLPHRIWRVESEIKKGDKPHLMGEREQRLRDYQSELAEVKRLLGING